MKHLKTFENYNQSINEEFFGLKSADEKAYKNTATFLNGDSEEAKKVKELFKKMKPDENTPIKLDNNLMKQINISLEKNPRNYLFSKSDGTMYNSNSWTVSANRILKRLINPSFSLTMFRHIYLSRPELNMNDKTIKEKKEVADSMAHSVDTQSKYIWKK